MQLDTCQSSEFSAIYLQTGCLREEVGAPPDMVVQEALVRFFLSKIFYRI